jgi:transposase-like protein
MRRRQGTREDAQWYSFAANKTHGLKRSNEDKQRAVKAALAHPKGAAISDSQIAKHVGVSIPTVSAWRGKLEATLKILKSPERIGRDGRTINTENIGRRATVPPIVLQPPTTQTAAPVRVSVVEQTPAPAHNEEQECLDGILAACGEIGSASISARIMADYIAARHDNNSIYELLEIANEYVTKLLARKTE